MSMEKLFYCMHEMHTHANKTHLLAKTTVLIIIKRERETRQKLCQLSVRYFFRIIMLLCVMY